MAYVALPPYDVEITKKWCKKEVDYILPAKYISIYVYFFKCRPQSKKLYNTVSLRNNTILFPPFE